jgi:hypothetical protein
MKLDRTDFVVNEAVRDIRVKCFMAKCRLGLYYNPTQEALQLYLERCERMDDDASN